jgi:hypothetical protein
MIHPKGRRQLICSKKIAFPEGSIFCTAVANNIMFILKVYELPSRPRADVGVEAEVDVEVGVMKS